MNYKKFYLFFLVLFSFFILTSFCDARTLELDYPKLPEGEQITEASGLPEYILYVYKFGMFFCFLIAILSLTIAGVFYIISPAIPSLKAKAKDRVFGAVTGIIFLLLIYLVIATINPELRILKSPEVVKVVPSAPFTPIASGVSLYKEASCNDKSIYSPIPFTTSIRDLSDARKTLNGLKIIPDTQLNILYFAITHDLVNFKGQCQYFYQNDKSCKKVDPFVSISIHQYAETPTGDGVTFYRESFYDKKGGWFKVGNNEIQGIYQKPLESLEFKGVPKEEQDCIEWDLNGKCLKRKPPNLAGENISSIKIDGNYIVVFINWNPVTGEWLACQVFPTVDDVNKEGPKQIKWEYIQQRDNLPSWVAIAPIREK